MADHLSIPLVIAGLSHHNAHVTDLESFRFSDEPAFLAQAADRFKGVVLLQTCNRVEILVEGAGSAVEEFLSSLQRKGFYIFEGKPP
jgi:glutamyl-tRNA reductase